VGEDEVRMRYDEVRIAHNVSSYLFCVMRFWPPGHDNSWTVSGTLENTKARSSCRTADSRFCGLLGFLVV